MEKTISGDLQQSQGVDSVDRMTQTFPSEPLGRFNNSGHFGCVHVPVEIPKFLEFIVLA